MTKVTVLGINGHFGIAIARAFADAGHAVTGFGRTNKNPDPRVRFAQGDAENVEDMRRAIGDSEIVVNALNLRYDQWTNGRKEAQIARVVAAVGTSGKTLMFPGSIYGYAPSERVVTPQSPKNPPTFRGEIQVRAERLIEDAARRGDIQGIVIRAGDFLGPDSTGDWIDQAILREKGKVAMLGKANTGHSWAYLPDLAKAFVTVADNCSTLEAFELLHFAGYYVTSEEFAAAVQAASPVPLKAIRFPWFFLTLLGLTDPVMRDVAKMRYIWENAMELRDDRLDALLGADFGTPFSDAIAATVARYVQPMKLAA